MANLSKSKDTKVGDVWLCFEGTKKRPVVIINDELVGVDLDVVITRVTSKSAKNKYDIAINHWKEAGLDKPSIVRCSKINTIHRRELYLKIGELHLDDLTVVMEKVEEFLKTWRNSSRFLADQD